MRQTSSRSGNWPGLGGWGECNVEIYDRRDESKIVEASYIVWDGNEGVVWLLLTLLPKMVFRELSLRILNGKVWNAHSPCRICQFCTFSFPVENAFSSI